MQSKLVSILAGTTPATIFVSAILAGCASRAVPEASAPTPVQRDVPAEVAAEFRKSTSAWNSGDLESFLSFYADTATLAQREGFLVGKTGIRLLYEPRFAAGSKRDTLAMERIDVEEIAPDVALVRGVYKATPDRGAPTRGTTTIIMKRIQGKWRVIHDHTT